MLGRHCYIPIVALSVIMLIVLMSRKYAQYTAAPIPTVHRGQRPAPSPARPLRITMPVLVMGSGGLVGRGLVRALHARGHVVEEIKGRADRDLRRPEVFTDMLSLRNYSFCFFLACEVGGARYLNDERNTGLMLRHNRLIYDQVFPFLQRRNIPFIFTSSQLATTATPYGQMKRDGEVRTNATGLGKSVRFWNVYGPEALGQRSHVLSDWIRQCIVDGEIYSLTNGAETRIFTHTDDIGRGLVLLMEHFDEMEQVVDLTRLEPVTSLHQLAAHIANASDFQCTDIVFPRTMVATFSKSHTPRASPTLKKAKWDPRISLDEGIRSTLAYFRDDVIRDYDRACRDTPYISLIMATRDDDHGADMWARTVNALRFFIQYARAAYLPFEIIIGEYNQRPGDGLLAERPDWPRGALYRIRTIPQAVHMERAAVNGSVFFIRQKDDSFWEYSGKNVAARIARGTFLLLFNPDNFIHPELIELIARRGLNEQNVYRARLSQTVGYSIADMSKMTPDEIALKVLGGAPPGIDLGPINEGPRGAFYDASGDFTMVSRARFLDVGGYPELPWNTHMDSLGLRRFLCVGDGPLANTTWYPNRTQVTFEHGIWHQPQNRNTDWSTPWDAIFAAWPCDQKQANNAWGFAAPDLRITETTLDLL